MRVSVKRVDDSTTLADRCLMLIRDAQEDTAELPGALREVSELTARCRRRDLRRLYRVIGLLLAIPRDLAEARETIADLATWQMRSGRWQEADVLWRLSSSR